MVRFLWRVPCAGMIHLVCVATQYQQDLTLGPTARSPIRRANRALWPVSTRCASASWSRSTPPIKAVIRLSVRDGDAVMLLLQMTRARAHPNSLGA
jgi:hypothetical protein